MKFEKWAMAILTIVAGLIIYDEFVAPAWANFKAQRAARL